MNPVFYRRSLNAWRGIPKRSSAQTGRRTVKGRAKGFGVVVKTSHVRPQVNINNPILKGEYKRVW